MENEKPVAPWSYTPQWNLIEEYAKTHESKKGPGRLNRASYDSRMNGLIAAAVAEVEKKTKLPRGKTPTPEWLEYKEALGIWLCESELVNVHYGVDVGKELLESMLPENPFYVTPEARKAWKNANKPQASTSAPVNPGHNQPQASISTAKMSKWTNVNNTGGPNPQVHEAEVVAGESPASILRRCTTLKGKRSNSGDGYNEPKSKKPQHNKRGAPSQNCGNF